MRVTKIELIVGTTEYMGLRVRLLKDGIPVSWNDFLSANYVKGDVIRLDVPSVEADAIEWDAYNVHHTHKFKVDGVTISIPRSTEYGAPEENQWIAFVPIELRRLTAIAVPIVVAVVALGTLLAISARRRKP